MIHLIAFEIICHCSGEAQSPELGIITFVWITMLSSLFIIYSLFNFLLFLNILPLSFSAQVNAHALADFFFH
ncbi:hypothetical protein RIF29_36703 [Crotalaria pallida]|uniref:Uncharacterized protein n=1 Tax=Crotalaria pallida TaxID=3830 RepID=A0AAN9HSF5_CROPI